VFVTFSQFNLIYYTYNIYLVIYITIFSITMSKTLVVILNVVMLDVTFFIMLRVIMLNVVMLNVVMLTPVSLLFVTVSNSDNKLAICVLHQWPVL
jgi:hypothetical protein